MCAKDHDLLLMRFFAMFYGGTLFAPAISPCVIAGKVAQRLRASENCLEVVHGEVQRGSLPGVASGRTTYRALGASRATGELATRARLLTPSTRSNLP